jgi:hypothetical protein
MLIKTTPGPIARVVRVTARSVGVERALGESSARESF